MSSWTVVPCLGKLREEFNELSPNRDKGADGTIGDSNHKSISDHTPDEDSDILKDHDADSKNEVHALDIDSDGPWPGTGTQKQRFHAMIMGLVSRERKRWLNPKDMCRLKYIIWDRRIYSQGNDFKGQSYSGGDPHTNHAHFSARYETKCENDTQSWGLLEGFGTMALIFDDINDFNKAIAAANTLWANSDAGKRAICQALVNTDDLVPSPQNVDLKLNPFTKVKSYFVGTHNKVLDVETAVKTLAINVDQIKSLVTSQDPAS